MARLPHPGSDSGTWGDLLNAFLSEAHDSDGALKNGSITSVKLASDVQAAVANAVTEVGLDKQWIVSGPINVASGDIDYIIPVYISVPAGFTATITTVRSRINSGTNVSLRVVKNGVALTGLSAVTVTPAGVALTGLNLAVADGDQLAPLVNSTSGGPQNMTVMVGYNLSKS